MKRQQRIRCTRAKMQRTSRASEAETVERSKYLKSREKQIYGQESFAPEADAADQPNKKQMRRKE
jgi:hypothetical protein